MDYPYVSLPSFAFPLSPSESLSFLLMGVEDDVMTIELDKVSYVSRPVLNIGEVLMVAMVGQRTYRIPPMVAPRPNAPSQDRYYEDPTRELEALGLGWGDERDGGEDDGGCCPPLTLPLAEICPFLGTL